MLNEYEQYPPTEEEIEEMEANQEAKEDEDEEVFTSPGSW